MRRLSLAAAAVALVASVSCITFEDDFTGNADGPRLAFIGDSITYLMADLLHEAYDPVAGVVVNARVGATSEMMEERAHHVAALDPWAVVVNLGTNDASTDAPVEDLVAHYDALLAAFDGSDTCLVLVTVIDSLPDDPAYNARTAEFNDAVRARGDVIVDWAPAIAEHPEWVSGLHPTEEGQAVLFDAYLDGLGRCPTIWVPSSTEPPTTEYPTTEYPTTEYPTTEPSTTEPSTTEPPTTVPSTTGDTSTSTEPPPGDPPVVIIPG